MATSSENIILILLARKKFLSVLKEANIICKYIPTIQTNTMEAPNHYIRLNNSDWNS